MTRSLRVTSESFGRRDSVRAPQYRHSRTVADPRAVRTTRSERFVIIAASSVARTSPTTPAPHPLDSSDTPPPPHLLTPPGARPRPLGDEEHIIRRGGRRRGIDGEDVSCCCFVLQDDDNTRALCVAHAPSHLSSLISLNPPPQAGRASPPPPPRTSMRNIAEPIAPSVTSARPTSPEHGSSSNAPTSRREGRRAATPRRARAPTATRRVVVVWFAANEGRPRALPPARTTGPPWLTGDYAPPSSAHASTHTRTHTRAHKYAHTHTCARARARATRRALREHTHARTRTSSRRERRTRLETVPPADAPRSFRRAPSTATLLLLLLAVRLRSEGGGSTPTTPFLGTLSSTTMSGSIPLGRYWKRK